MRESVPILRYQETGQDDRYGSPKAEWAPLPEPLSCGVADDSGLVTQSAGRDQVAFDFMLLLEPGQEVLTSDRLVVRGLTCEVVKPHFEWKGLFSDWNPGGTVYVKAVEG